MTPQAFGAAVFAHPVGKYVTNVDATAFTAGFGADRTVWRRSVGGARSYFVGSGAGDRGYQSLPAALDAMLAILEPPKPRIPAGFVAVDVPTILRKDGSALGVVDDDLMFYMTYATNVTWLAVAPPALSDEAREWLRTCTGDVRKAWMVEEIKRCAREIARALGVSP